MDWLVVHDAVICVYDAAGNVTEIHEHARDSNSAEFSLA